MFRLRISIAACLILSGLVVWLWVGSSPRSLAAPADESAAIKKLLDKQMSDWNCKDLDGFLETYWHDPGVVFQSGGTRSDGFEAMRSRYKARYQGEGKEMGQLVFSGLEIVPLSPDAAFARGRWRLTLSNGKTPGGLFTLILRKRPEGWRIVHDHTSSDTP